MNIVILSYHRIGGSGIVAYEIGRAMAEDKGHQVHFMGLEPPFRLKNNVSEDIRFHKVWVKEYPVFDYQPYDLALTSQLSDIIEHYDIDVIHSHYALPFAVSAILARDVVNKPVTCVTTLHGTDITVVGAHPSMKNITRYAIEKSDVVTAVSHFLREESEKKLGIPEGKIETVYNFINTQYFNSGLKIPHWIEKNKHIVIHISNLRPVKRPLDVIQIFHRMIKKTGIPLELWIVGEGPLQCEMMGMAEKLGIQEQVRFMGSRSDIGELIASANLMLLPSEHESFGLAALEAMACEVPVVASRVGGVPEVIDGGHSGMLFEVGNIEEASDKAVQILSDKKLNRTIRKNALHTVTHRFGLNKIIDQYETLYRRQSLKN